MVKCNLCKSNDVKLFHTCVWGMEGSKVYRCNNCDITFIWPNLTSDQEANLYKNYNEYVTKRTNLIKVEVGEFHEKSLVSAKVRYNIVKDLFQDVDTVLEVGSSTGAFLSLLNEKECFGVEKADDNREFSRKFAKMIYSDIADIEDDKKFDLICMFHVFEHIKDPFVFIDNCKKHLNEKGIILIEVPHIEDALISLYNCKEYKDFYFQPMHPYVYSLKSLEYVFFKQGLKTVKVLYSQRYGLDNHLGWLSQKRDDINKIKSIIGENKDYETSLVKANLTDTIFYIAKKK